MDNIDIIKDLANKVSYEAPRDYISGRITEYDLRAANINCLKHLGLISDNEYNYFLNLPKWNREVEVGHLQRENISIYNAISDEIKRVKYNFLVANHIDPSSIVRIANDAVYINSFINLQYLFFDDTYEFRIKGQYNVMMRLGKNITLFVRLDDNNYDVDVKGINDNKLFLHESFLSFLCNIIFNIERVGIKEAIKLYNDFYEKYVKRELDINYYREFNAASLYRHKSGFLMSQIQDVKDLRIDYNLYLLRELWSILLSLTKIK